MSRKQSEVTSDNLVVLGHVMKPQGLKGAMKVRIANDAIPNLTIDEPVFIPMQGGPVPFFIEDLPDTTRSIIVLKLEGINSVDASNELVGKDVLVAPDQLNYAEDHGLMALVGFTVSDTVLGDIGVVSGVMELPQQSILEVTFQGKEILIPAVENIIEVVDMEKRHLVVSTPDGLVDLYING
jgi:16S rRNA processing protein RimM